MKRQRDGQTGQKEMIANLPGKPVAPSGSDSALLSANGLFYRLPQSLSTTNFRNDRRQYADRTEYVGSKREVMRFVWNTGGAYIDPATAYIAFEVEVSDSHTSTQAWGFGDLAAGACNLFSEIQIRSRNGKELDRVTHCDKIASIRAQYLLDAESRAMLECAGFSGTENGAFASSGVAAGVYGAGVQVAIPLHLLSGFFRPLVKGTKIPAPLASGLVIELTLNKPATALFKTDVTGTPEFKIKNPTLHLQSSDLNDPTVATIMATSAEVGLDYVYTSTFVDMDTRSQSTYNQVSQKAVSQCTRTYMSIYNAADQTAPDFDSYKSIPKSQVDKWQWRLGSNYFPQNELKHGPESYLATLQAFDRDRDLPNNRPNSVKYSEFLTKKMVLAQNISSDSRLLLAGAPINNSNVLELQIQVVTNDVPYLYLVVMEYISVAKAFLTYTDLKI